MGIVEVNGAQSGCYEFGNLAGRGIWETHASGHAARGIQMSKHPSPRVNQLRAMREAKFARNEQRQQEDAKSATPAKTKSKAKKKIER